MDVYFDLMYIQSRGGVCGEAIHLTQNACIIHYLIVTYGCHHQGFSPHYIKGQEHLR